MNNQDVEKWLSGLSARSLAAVALYHSQDEKPKMAIEYAKAMFWSLGRPCPVDVAALATDGAIRDADLAARDHMPNIELTPKFT